MKDHFSINEIEEIVEYNQEIVEARSEPFGVNWEELQRIFHQINDPTIKFNDEQERIIFQASWILGGISFYQPFSEGNKETALSLTILFLRRNNFNLPLDSKEKEKEVFDILEKTIFKFEGDTTIISEIQEFLKNRIVRI